MPPSRQVGPFEIVEKLGAGGMAVSRGSENRDVVLASGWRP